MQNDLMPGTICIAAQGHDPLKPNELAFEKGDVLTIVSELTEGGQHYQASAADGEIGLFPSSAILKRPPVPMVPMPWFHGAISRLDAEKLLDRNQDGQFLLRTSQNTQGVYALAISCKGKVNHYLVATDFRTRKLTIDGKRYCQDLPALVEYYKSHSGNLGTTLKYPVIRRRALEFYVDPDKLKNWGLPKSDIELSQLLGRGEFGEVHSGMYRGTQVAVKNIHESKQSDAAVANFLREASFMTQVRHKNLVQLVGLVLNGSQVNSIIMELMGKGSLQKYLISRGRSVLTLAELISFARDVCAGMTYISSQGFVHRDLAARNVLLNNNGQAKISDFGLARRANIFVPHEGGKFPVKWTAPEALKDSKFSTMSDVWSFGVFLWEVYSFGRTPYPSIPSEEVLETLEDGLLMDPPEGCPTGIYDIMCSCWEMEPNDRPSFPSLQQMLSQSFGLPIRQWESLGMRLGGPTHPPHSSSLPSRDVVSTIPDVEELVMSPVATRAYREAPITRKATMLAASIAFLGPQGSGKTSLLRSLMGEPFRLMEPMSLKISISDNYYDLKERTNWLPSTAGLMYEDELVRIIVEDLLKHMQSVFTSSPAADTPPPLPRRRWRSQSFNGGQVSDNIEEPSHDLVSTVATSRLSGNFEVIESGTLEGKLELGVRSQPVADKPGNMRQRHGKRSFIGRFLRSKGGEKDQRGVRRHYSDSAQRGNYTDSGEANGSVSPQFYSSLPERLIAKIKASLTNCSGGSLPLEYFGKMVDIPGSTSFEALKPLFITENSICILVYDVSRDILSVPSPGLRRKSPVGAREVKQNGIDSPRSQSPSTTYLDQIMTEISNVCLHWSHSKADMTIKGPRIVLVGTHSDKVPSSVSNHNFEVLRDAVKSSPYAKYIAMMRYIISSSSIIERSAIDDLKKFVMEVIKKACRQQVPLRWLRCVRRFQGLAGKGVNFMSLEDARKLVTELCDLVRPEDIMEVLEFLHQNQVILHFHHIHQLKAIVITSPQWFARQVSAVFSAPSIIDVEGSSYLELLPDQALARSKGILTNQLLDFIWREKDVHANKDELLTIMHKMDLICCMGSDSQPLCPFTSVENVAQDVNMRKNQPPKFSVSSVVVPTLVEDPMPPQLSSLPVYNVEQLYFRFRQGFIPSGLFSRFVVRCIHSYPNNFSTYRNAATFEVDATSLLMLSTGKDFIRVGLHRIREHRTESLISSLASTNLDNLLNDDTQLPNPDTCMVILMFIQATMSDLIQQWMPHVDYDLCIACDCHHPRAAAAAGTTKIGPRISTSSLSSSEDPKRHYVILSDVDNLLHKSILHCEEGTQVTALPTLTCWFGVVPEEKSTKTSTSDEIDYVTDKDIEVVSKNLGTSWVELGQTLGFSGPELESFSLRVKAVHSKAGERMLREWQTLHRHNATFFALLGALEIIQRRDIADSLVAARMAGEGIAV